MNKELKTNGLIISISKKLKTLIEDKFSSIYSENDLIKIYFLIYKINKEGIYQIKNSDHAWMLSMRKDEVSNILDTLTETGVIKLVTKHKSGERSRSFQLIHPFDYKSEDCFRINFYEGQSKFPIWVQKYIADGGIVKAKEYSNYKKNSSTVTKEDTNSIDLINELKAEIADLKRQLASKDKLYLVDNEDDETLEPVVKEFNFDGDKINIINFNLIENIAADENELETILQTISDENGKTGKLMYYNIQFQKETDWINNTITVQLSA